MKTKAPKVIDWKKERTRRQEIFQEGYARGVNAQKQINLREAKEQIKRALMNRLESLLEEIM